MRRDAIIRGWKCGLIAAMFAVCAFGAEDWGPLQMLLGTWSGEGSGGPGQGKGSFSFYPSLQGKILVRKNVAEYPAANGKPASRHDDLMIVYRDLATRQFRANYYDSEEHVIQYTVKAAEAGVVFVTETPASEVRYRMTYTATDKDRMKLKFEIAAPGKDFVTYIDASLRRESVAAPR